MRGVIFDLDNTLYPRQRFINSGLAAVAHYAERRFGVPASEGFTTMLRASVRTPRLEFQAFCDMFGLGPDRLPEMLAVFRAHTPALWLFHDAEAALQQLRADGWQLAILTNGAPEVQARKVKALDVERLVEHVIFAAAHAEGGKPHADAFREALRRLELPADRCVMVGDDGECDVDGAAEAGLRTIWMKRAETASAPAADVVLEFLSGVPAAAESLVCRVTTHAA